MALIWIRGVRMKSCGGGGELTYGGGGHVNPSICLASRGEFCTRLGDGRSRSHKGTKDMLSENLITQPWEPVREPANFFKATS